MRTQHARPVQVARRHPRDWDRDNSEASVPNFCHKRRKNCSENRKTGQSVVANRRDARWISLPAGDRQLFGPMFVWFGMGAERWKGGRQRELTSQICSIDPDVRGTCSDGRQRRVAFTAKREGSHPDLGGGAFPQLVEASLSGRLSPRNSGGTTCCDSPGLPGVWQRLDLARSANAQGRKNADTASRRDVWPRCSFPARPGHALGRSTRSLKQTLWGSLGVKRSRPFVVHCGRQPGSMCVMATIPLTFGLLTRSLTHHRPSPVATHPRSPTCKQGLGELRYTA